MKCFKLDQTGDRGWFIGNFPKAIIQTDQFEVCFKTEPAGSAKSHYHTVCKEIVLIVDGVVNINNDVYSSGDILVFDKGEINDMQYSTTTTMVGIKVPAGGDDKVLL